MILFYIQWTSFIDDKFNIVISINYLYNRMNSVSPPNSILKVIYNFNDINSSNNPSFIFSEKYLN